MSVTEFFKGDNWRVHPDWVYCEYNSVSDLEKERESSGESTSRDQEPSFGSPEEQVLHFLARAGRPGWKWMSVRRPKRIIFDFVIYLIIPCLLSYRYDQSRHNRITIFMLPRLAPLIMGHNI